MEEPEMIKEAIRLLEEKEYSEVISLFREYHKIVNRFQCLTCGNITSCYRYENDKHTCLCGKSTGHKTIIIQEKNK